MIFDCFLFNDELMLLELRLKELAGCIDKFVLVESTHTHAGKPKRLHFKEHRQDFVIWQNKIIHVIDHSLGSDDRWLNERTQRMSISGGLEGRCQPDDIIIVEDADEIPNPRIVPIVKQLSMPGRLLMRNYYYYFNCRKDDWPWPAFCRFRDFTSAQSLRVGSDDRVLIPNGGWHFGYVMSGEKIAEKLGQFSHSEYDTPYFRDINRIERCRREMTDLFERTDKHYELESIKDLPQTIQQNQTKYAEFLLNGNRNCHPILQEQAAT